MTSVAYRNSSVDGTHVILKNRSETMKPTGRRSLVPRTKHLLNVFFKGSTDAWGERANSADCLRSKDDHSSISRFSFSRPDGA